MAKEKKDRCGTAGLFIPGGLLAGMGFGFIYGNLTAGLFIGLGAGFVVMAIIMLLCRCRK